MYRDWRAESGLISIKGGGEVMSLFKTAAVVLLVISCASTSADFRRFDTKIEKILVDSSAYGGCIAYINSSPQGLGLGCASAATAVTFDCLNSRGDTDKSIAQQKLGTAQLAFVTNRVVTLKVIDSGILPNGICFADYINVK